MSKYAYLITKDDLVALVMLDAMNRKLPVKGRTFKMTNEEKYYPIQNIRAIVYREE